MAPKYGRTTMIDAVLDIDGRSALGRFSGKYASLRAQNSTQCGLACQGSEMCIVARGIDG
jgi:hypothetical protein